MSQFKTTALIIHPLGSEIKGPGIPNLVKILSLLSIRTIVLTGLASPVHTRIDTKIKFSKVEGFERLRRVNPNNLMARLFNNLLEQMLLAFSIIKLRDSITFVIFCYILSPVPLLISRILGKKTITYVASSPYLTALAHNKISRVLVPSLEHLTYHWSDLIVVISRRLETLPILIEYRKKILYAPIFLPNENFFHRFDCKTSFLARKRVVGFIGRLEEEKGAINFVKAIPLVVSHLKDTRFMIIGEGSLKERIVKDLQASRIRDHVEVIGWVSDVENYLKDLKSLVLPSTTEGLPFIVLEAMACGTPVLATTVGAIPDIIIDRENGFLLKSNDPKHIADKIVDLLSKPELLEKVSQNAHEWVRENFSEEKTLKYWRRILQEIEPLHMKANEKNLEHIWKPLNSNTNPKLET